MKPAAQHLQRLPIARAAHPIDQPVLARNPPPPPAGELAPLQLAAAADPGEAGWYYAPGWLLAREEDGGTMLRHLGSNNFFAAQAALWPARDQAVLLVTNLGDDAAEPAFRRLLEQLRPSATG